MTAVTASCGGGGGGSNGSSSSPPPPQNAAPASILLSSTAVTLDALGATAQLSATVRDSGGNTLTAPVSWTSSSPAVATVASTGQLTAVSNGSTIVTASAGSVSAVSAVTVRQVPADVAISPADVTLLQPGTAVTLVADVRDARGQVVTDVPVTWSSSDSAVARVDGSGTVTAVASAGVATITATAAAANKAARLEVVAPSSHVVQFVYVSPARSSDALDQQRYVSVIDRLATDPAFAWIGTEDRGRYASESASYAAGTRDFRYHEPSDGSTYPGTDPARFAERARHVQKLADQVQEFYTYHSGKTFRMTPLKSVRLEESALHYFTPVIHSTSNVDRDPIVNKIFAELIRRDEIAADASSGRRIHVLLMDGGGGWAGAWQWGVNTGRDPFGGLAAVGDFSNCLMPPATPAAESAADRLRWPGHLLSSWVRCSYNLALGTVIHELGHSFGLPHPADFQCAGLSERLIMQSHWNTDLASAGFFPGSNGTNNVGILKEWDPIACRPTDLTQGFAAGLGTPARPDGNYRNERDILRENPHFR